MTSSQSADTAKDEAQVALGQLPIKVGQWYRHYKGGEYEVIALALKEDTLEPLVIYRSPTHNDTVWARSWDDWNATIEWGGESVKRFTKK